MKQSAIEYAPFRVFYPYLRTVCALFGTQIPVTALIEAVTGFSFYLTQPVMCGEMHAPEMGWGRVKIACRRFSFLWLAGPLLFLRELASFRVS